mmetsp:Transcript_1833/g.4202  ORF Transcript_1833/g.4202 Transcript_1833/m.4202 type:complete len:448 (-) Transcript_1833:187-1530(-)
MSGEANKSDDDNMSGKIHVEEITTSNGGRGGVHALNIEMAGAGEGNGEQERKIDVAEGEEGAIYPDKDGKTLFDRHYLGTGKPVPPYVGLQNRVSAVTWVELFAMQQLPAWRPVITPAQVVLTLVGMGVAMLAIGIGCTVSTMGVVQVSENYSQLSPPQSQTVFTNDQKSRYLRENGGYNVTVDLRIEKDMEPPIYAYYELTNFFQNNRRYVRSVSPQQLAGLPTSLDNLKLLCEPMLYVGGALNDSYPEDGQISPCGLQAWSYFNDTFSFTRLEGAAAAGPEEGAATAINVDDSQISWPTDKSFLYGNVTAENFNVYPEYRGGGTVAKPLNQEQHFMVWMRLSAKPNFWKLWGVIDQKLFAGDVVRVSVLNQFNTYDFNGKKSIVLSTNSWLGNKNYFLGALYLAVGGLFIIVGLLFQIAYWFKPRGFADEMHLSWNRNSGVTSTS